METARVTYVKGTRMPKLDELDPIPVGRKLTTTEDGYLELRDTRNQIIRLGPKSEIVYKETIEGLRPVFYGEVFEIFGRDTSIAGGKYRTSCWMEPTQPPRKTQRIAHGFYGRARGKNMDEFVALYGELPIYEYDENKKRYIICSVPENMKAVLTYNPEQTGRGRYKAKIVDVSEKEYEYILVNFIGNKNWK